MRIPASALVMLAAISQLTACAIHRAPVATERYGVNRVVLPERLGAGDRVDLLFEDGTRVSVRIVDWNASQVIADYDGRRTVHPWHQIEAVLAPREPEAVREPSLSGAMRRFFLVIGVVALFASAVS